jgi:opacity protein-like surface antigen
MRTTRLATAALAALLLSWASGPAAAQAPAAQAPLAEEDFRSGTTGDLADLCGASANDPMRAAAIGWCHGFILATAQYHSTIAARRTAGHPLYCIPTDSPTFDQVRASFVAWARANPQFEKERAVDGLLRFAAVTYPCPTRGGSATRR